MTQPAGQFLDLPQVAQIDVDAERCVLGSMILSTAAVEAVIGIVKPDDFYRPIHAELFRTLTDLYSRSEPIDAVTLASTLANTLSPAAGHASYLSWIGGTPFLHTLIAVVPSEASASYYARIVADAAVRRRLTQAGLRITQIGMQATGLEPSELVDQARMEVDRILADPKSKSVPLKTALARAMDTIGQDGDVPGLRTGFRDLDELIGPMRPGMLIVIAGRPGQGKTVLAADIARHVALTQARTTLYATFEMSVEEMALRNLCAESTVRYERLRDGTLDDTDIAKLELAAERIETAPFETWDAAGVGLMDFRAECRRHLQSSRPLGLAVLDYIGLADVNPRLSSRQEQVAELSRGLKITAKELGITVVAVAQLNRNNEGRNDKRPQLSDLRESGQIEQDADIVIMVHRDDYYDTASSRSGEVDFMVVKNRHGRTGTVAASAQLHYMRFKDFAREYRYSSLAA